MKRITDTNISTRGPRRDADSNRLNWKDHRHDENKYKQTKHFQTNDCFQKWRTLHATSALIVKLTVDYLLALCLWMKNNQQSFENNQTLNTSGLIHETQEQIQFCVKTFLQTFPFT